MATKRDYDTLDYSDTAESTPALQPSKRQRKQEEYKKRKQNSGQPGVDPTYGQRNAFPVDSLTTPSDDDLEFEDQTDALAYLRSVQQETKQIPHVVVAPKAGPQLPPELETDRSIYESGVGDTRGYYHDGAYTAAPEPGYLSSPPRKSDSVQDDDYADPVKRHAALVESYCTSLMGRYTTLRNLLQTTPPQSAIDALPTDHETYVDKFGPRSSVFKKWEHRLRNTDPLPAQIAAMDKVSVLRLLRVIMGGIKFLRRGATLRERTSRWIWALLARLPDRGELDSTEIGWVRDLGKRAVAVSISREHARALAEVVDRAQLKAFGLGGVLNEIDDEEVVEEEEEEEEEGNEEEGEEYAEAEEMEVVGGDEALSVSKDAGLNSSPPVPRKEDEVASQSGEDIPMDLEDGEVDEVPEPKAPQAQYTAVPDQAKAHKEATSDMDNGEISDHGPSKETDQEVIAAVKARLLASLESAEKWEEPPTPPSLPKKKASPPDPLAEQFNMRTTVNMILTVAGEFYGQRDLLQFRAPFAEF